jgi:putative ABC transport system substrate-binding protein
MGKCHPAGWHQSELKLRTPSVGRDRALRDHAMPTVGIIAAGAASAVEGFKAGMRECGFFDKENIRYRVRVAHGASAKLSTFATEMVETAVDLIAVVGAVTARAAQEATTHIPIVYAVVVDPISDGLASTAGKPLGNTTGITTFDPDQARTQQSLLRSIKPRLARIALLADTNVSDCLVNANALAAEEAGLRTQVLHVSGPDPDFEKVFAAMRHDGAEALVVLEHPINGANAAIIAKLALSNGLPTIMAREQANAGGLFSYGTRLSLAAHQMARLAGRILRAEKPCSVAIEVVHRRELVVNMATARGLGLTVPPDIRDRALAVLNY